jgi:hypothetical protein
MPRIFFTPAVVDHPNQFIVALQKSWGSMGWHLSGAQNLNTFEIYHDRVCADLAGCSTTFVIGWLFTITLSVTFSRDTKKTEPVPTLKAAIRLLSQIFNMAKDVPEFQRQVATPNVSKFSLVLIGLVQNQTDKELKVRLSNYAIMS